MVYTLFILFSQFIYVRIFYCTCYFTMQSILSYRISIFHLLEDTPCSVRTGGGEAKLAAVHLQHHLYSFYHSCLSTLSLLILQI